MTASLPLDTRLCCLLPRKISLVPVRASYIFTQVPLILTRQGSSDADPTTVDSDGCEHSSCPPNAPAFGANATDPRLNYVNSFPVTSIKRGISVTGPALWSGAAPQLAVTGPNVGSNVDIQAFFSGTIGAAVYAATTANIPAIAFSGKSGDPTAWNVSPVPIHSKVCTQVDSYLNVTHKSS